MTLRNFIKVNRKEIDRAIKLVCPNVRLNDISRQEWILNDEDLYLWAAQEGVRL
jgi:hypothetical protein